MRLATDLGLHMDAAPFAERGLIDLEEARLRSSTFWGTYAHERLACSFTYRTRISYIESIAGCGACMSDAPKPLTTWTLLCSFLSQATLSLM